MTGVPWPLLEMTALHGVAQGVDAPVRVPCDAGVATGVATARTMMPLTSVDSTSKVCDSPNVTVARRLFKPGIAGERKTGSHLLGETSGDGSTMVDGCLLTSVFELCRDTS